MRLPAPRRLLCTALLCLAALPAAQARDKPDPVALDAAFQPAERAVALLNAADTTAFKDLRRAAIASFQVEFMTRGSATATAREFGRSGSASSSMSIALSGVGEPDFEAITEQLYADFVRDLQALGVEVLPAEAVLAAAAYRKMAATGGPAPFRKSGGGRSAVVMAPQGLAVYGFSTAATGSSVLGALNAFSALGSAFSAATGSMDLQKELDASVLTVRIVLDFADLASSSASFWGRMSGEASVKARVAPTVVPTETMMSVQGASTASTMLLQAPLTLPADAFREIRDVTSTGGAIALAVLAAAIGQSASASEKEAIAEPAQYRATIGTGLGTLRQMMIARLQHAR